ncbi:MAG: hypothetical protein PVJ67_01445 [Candidatus Pacearchaeota archaeon]|jgi:hypothetical protein
MKNKSPIKFSPELPLNAILLESVLCDEKNPEKLKLIIDSYADKKDSRWHHLTTISQSIASRGELYNSCDAVARQTYVGYVGDKSSGKIWGIHPTNPIARVYSLDEKRGREYFEELKRRGLWNDSN